MEHVLSDRPLGLDHVFSSKFNDSRQNDWTSGKEESNTDSAQWGKVEAEAAQAWVHNSVDERDDNQQRDVSKQVEGGRWE